MPCFRPSLLDGARPEPEPHDGPRPLAVLSPFKSSASLSPSPPLPHKLSTRQPLSLNNAREQSPQRPKTASAPPTKVLALLTTTLSGPTGLSATPSVDNLSTHHPVKKAKSTRSLRTKPSTKILRPKTALPSDSSTESISAADKTPPNPPLRTKASQRTLKTKKSVTSMASSTKSSARNFFHEKFQNHHPHLPRSSKSNDKSPKPNEKDPDYQRKKEEHKHFLCQFEERNAKEPLSPTEICKDPTEKQIGQSSKYLKKGDFKLVKTIGTGAYVCNIQSGR